MIDPFIVVLAIIATILIGCVIYVERAFARIMEEECERVDYCQSQDEVQFWDGIKSGPCRLSEKALDRKTRKLLSIRNPSLKEHPEIKIADARAEILMHVGRST